MTILTDRASFEMRGTVENVGVLLVHGFTGDTREIRPLADRINAMGIYCYAPLLPGHGGLPNLMEGLTYKTWLTAVQDAIHHVCQQHQHVFVCGFSMGGALSTIALSEISVDGFIALAPMIEISNPMVLLARITGLFTPWFYPLRFVSIDNLDLRDAILAHDPTLNLDDPKVLARLRNEIRFPVAAADELRTIIKHVHQAAPKIKIPTLIVQGEADKTVAPAKARWLYHTIPAQDKTLLMISGAPHQLMSAENPHQEQVLSTVTDWIAQHAQLTR